MTETTTAALVPTERPVHPEFTTEHLNVDLERATAVVDRTVRNLTATETPEGRTFRTPAGRLVAILAESTREAGTVDLHYRTAPASATATLKARTLARALRPFASV